VSQSLPHESAALATHASLAERSALIAALKAHPPAEAAGILAAVPAATAADALTELNPAFVQDVLATQTDEQRNALFAASPPMLATQWQRNSRYAADSLGRLMEPAYATFRADMTAAEAINQLRTLVRTAFITYGYVCDASGKLEGLVTMRELLFADRETRLASIMLRSVFTFTPETDVSAAMQASLSRHYPVYPVCDANGILLGLVRGAAIFEAKAFEITAQAGSMVGVEKEERISTSLWRSFRFRHPWLQLNLLTAFLAGGVVAMFQGTVDRLVILAAFLPVLAGQSGNTGCQALAVTLRGITLGEIGAGDGRKLIIKEGVLGALNGAPIGVVAGIAMYITAASQSSAHALTLAVVVFFAMVGACTISGISGAIVPLTLKRFGTDPATASSIFLTTATDIVSMGMLLGLATVLVPR
jgi:magnesium transporter